MLGTNVHMFTWASPRRRGCGTQGIWFGLGRASPRRRRGTQVLVYFGGRGTHESLAGMCKEFF
jgi:hypothetical protein